MLIFIRESVHLEIIKGLIVKYDVVDISGTVLKTFDSKNQAEKFKKNLNDHGYYGAKVIKNNS